MLHELSAAENSIVALVRETAAAVLRESLQALAGVFRDAAASPVPLDPDALDATVQAMHATQEREIDRHLHTLELARASFAKMREAERRVAEALGEPQSSSPDVPPAAEEPESVELTQADVITRPEPPPASEGEMWSSGRFDGVGPLTARAVTIAKEVAAEEPAPATATAQPSGHNGKQRKARR